MNGYMRSSASFADTKQHYELLDGLRGVAAILVVVYHIFEGFSFAELTNGVGDGLIAVLNHGHIAVDFFFILSGFVISYAYDDRWTKMGTWQFFKRRLVRLHPMLVMGALIGVVAFAYVGFERWDGTATPTAWVMISFVLTIFMVPAIPGALYEIRGNGEMFPLNGPTWSLFFEYLGNIVYATIIRRFSTKVLAVATLLLGVIYAWFFVGDVSGYDMVGVGWTIDEINFFGGFIRMLFPFSVGMLVARTFRPHKVNAPFWIGTLLLILLFSVPYIPSEGVVSLNSLYEVVCIAFVFPLIVWLGANGCSKEGFAAKATKFLGDISYPLYIVHYPIMYVFYAWLIENKFYSLRDCWGVALLVILSSIALAYLCMKLYDEPLRKWLSKHLLK